MATGMVAGFATITPASGFVGVKVPLFLVLAEGPMLYRCRSYKKLKVDDSLDVFAVHGVVILGTLLCSFLISASWGVGFAYGYFELITLNTILCCSYHNNMDGNSYTSY